MTEEKYQEKIAKLEVRVEDQSMMIALLAGAAFGFIFGYVVPWWVAAGIVIATGMACWRWVVERPLRDN